MRDGEHVTTTAQSEIHDDIEHLKAHLVDLDDEVEMIHAVMDDLDLVASAVEQAERRQEIIDNQSELIDAQDEQIDRLVAYIATLESNLHDCRSIIMGSTQE